MAGRSLASASSRFPMRRPLSLPSGGIGGNHDLLRQELAEADGQGLPDPAAQQGARTRHDGRMIGISESAGARMESSSDPDVALPRGIANYDPIWPDHGIAGSCLGRRRCGWTPPGDGCTAPLHRASTRSARIRHHQREQGGTTPGLCWTPTHHRQGVLRSPGQGQNPDTTSPVAAMRDVLARVRPARPRRDCRRSSTRGVDFVGANTLRDLVSAMNSVRDVIPLDYATVEQKVTAHATGRSTSRFTKDAGDGDPSGPQLSGRPVPPGRRPAPADRPRKRGR